ncbi:alkaline phosphatase [Alicyclobacillus hesperidum subsp. aegles]|uniref:DedA family protein n=1 Tax=Alicyclobacillus hesperidum TaxID=89784 RepID=UPI00222B3717|nr:DedA family protein [Alicyclobacillus hesperidum]GLG02640.1 alkaline phosphatase [Alicyclobacillus hesperidum subsp. aegles]
MHIHTHQMLQHYGYFGVFFILLLEMVGIPFPAETTLTISGFEWSNGAFKLIPLLLAAGLGNIVGSTIAFWIGRLLGRPVIVRFGKYVGITNERLDKANHMFHRHQSWIVIIGKFIAGIRVLIPYLAGVNKMNFAVFSLYNAVSAFVWAAVFIILGRYMGIEWSKYHQVLHQYLVPGIIVVAIVIGVVVALKMRHRKNVAR